MSKAQRWRWRQPQGRVLAILLVAALVGALMAGWSGYRLYNQLTRPARETDVSKIEAWMTLGYIVRTYRVPPDQLVRALGVPPEVSGRRTLLEIADTSGRPVEEVVADARRIVAELQANEPEPPPRWPGGVSPFRRGPAPGPGGDAPSKSKSEPKPEPAPGS